MPESGLPLWPGRASDSPLAWRDGRPLTVAQTLAEARAFAERLPPAEALVNLCVDRHRFTVAFIAGLMRGQPSLLPPNALPGTLAALPFDSRRLIAVGDDAALAVPDGLALIRMAPVGSTLSSGASGGSAPATVPPAGGAGSAVSTGGGAGAAVSPLAWPASQPAACLLTSGSTGTPQAWAKTWGVLVANVQAAAERLAETLGRPSLDGLTLVTTVPPQHSYGFESSVLLGLLGGASFDCGRPFFPADIVRALAAVPRPRALVTTPFHLKTLLLAGIDVPPVDLVLCATAPLSPQLAAQAERRFGGALLEIYGCTEAGQVATRRTVEGETWTTFGDLRLHVEAVQASSVGPRADRRDAATASAKQGAFLGAVDEAHANADAVAAAGSASQAGAGTGDAEVAETGERFIVHGGHVEQPTPLSDLLELDDPRHFRLLGRGNDLIKVAGRRSSLAHLNYHLNSIDGVVDGAFWLPDDRLDEVVRPIAFVVAPGLSSAYIVAALRERLEPVFVPRQVVSVDALPREATGKLPLHTLRAFAQARLQGAALNAEGAP